MQRLLRVGSRSNRLAGARRVCCSGTTRSDLEQLALSTNTSNIYSCTEPRSVRHAEHTYQHRNRRDASTLNHSAVGELLLAFEASYRMSQTGTASCRYSKRGEPVSRAAQQGCIDASDVFLRSDCSLASSLSAAHPAGTAAPDDVGRFESGPGERSACARDRASGGGRAHITSLPPWPGAPAATRRSPLPRSQRLRPEPADRRRQRRAPLAVTCRSSPTWRSPTRSRAPTRSGPGRAVSSACSSQPAVIGQRHRRRRHRFGHRRSRRARRPRRRARQPRLARAGRLGRSVRPRHAHRGHHRRQRDRGDARDAGLRGRQRAGRALRRRPRARQQRRRATRATSSPASTGRSPTPGATASAIINLSLGHPVTEPSATDPLCRAVARAVQAGLVVVVSAGNYGQTATGAPILGGITSPGNSPFAITVGALDAMGTVDRADDRVAPLQLARADEVRLRGQARRRRARRRASSRSRVRPRG